MDKVIKGAINPGERRVFRSYLGADMKHFEGEREHQGKVVTIVKFLEATDPVNVEGNLYLIRAEDGWEGKAFGFELDPLPR